jgi:hypothetical protein
MTEKVIKAAVDVILNYTNSGKEAALVAVEKLRRVIEGV